MFVSLILGYYAIGKINIFHIIHFHEPNNFKWFFFNKYSSHIYY